APKQITKFSEESSLIDLKREMVNMIIKYREDYPSILETILFEVPIKVNRYVMSELNRLEQFETLEHFLKQAFIKYRDYPEVFLWIAKAIMTGQWQYDWLHHGKEEVVLYLFRLLKPLVQIEKKGTRLKNSALETIFGTTNITVEHIREGSLPEIIAQTDAKSIRRMLALFKDVPYIPDAQKENFLQYIQEARPDYSSETMEEEGPSEAEEEEISQESLFPPDDVILVSESGLTKRKDHLNNLINVEMPANSRDIGEAQEKGDLRENAEYKAAMERQQQLQAEILKLTDELKKARIIEPSMVRTDVVTIGCKVSLATPDGENVSYSILGPWDADTDLNIISYRSPLGMALIGKTTGEEAILDKTKHFRINKIDSAI
ncbi:MAG: transcription elongation factor GreA, partial [Spirochaetia bacterium]|nr:transcription elongation factor GreA [Spirochaetia bacterium]